MVAMGKGLRMANNVMLVRVTEDDWKLLHQIRFAMRDKNPKGKMPTLQDAAHECIDHYVRLGGLERREE